MGQRCRASTIQAVARELRLDWRAVTALAKHMREQLRCLGVPGPKVVGIDEVSIQNGHTYRIVVSDLVRHRPIWFGGTDRSEASMDQFYQWLGPKKSHQIRLAVMDMWKAFRTSTLKPDHAPHAAILFDKFHVLRPLGDALDHVRKSEYARLTGKERAYINGQKYTLLSLRANLALDGRKALTKLLKANKRMKNPAASCRVLHSRRTHLAVHPQERDPQSVFPLPGGDRHYPDAGLRRDRPPS